MMNIGPKSSTILADVGIASLDDLRSVGVEEAFRRAKLANPSVTLNLLWGLEGAATECDWRDIDEPRKRELRRALTDIL